MKSMDDPATLLEVDGHHKFLICWDTVDGSEIRRSPVDMVNISHYLQGFICFIHPRWLFGISSMIINSIKPLQL